MTRNDRDLNTFLAVAHEVALADARDLPTTPAIRRRALAFVDLAHDGLAAMRRAELARAPAPIPRGEVRPSILAMARDALLARFDRLRVSHAEMQFAHRECVGMSDDDLRSLLEDAESTIERQG